jgi:hypothetical protein
MASDDFRYRLWYAPEFPVEGLDWRRNAKDRALMAFIDTMEEHIRRFGVKYPIGVFLKDGRRDVRPGKCRVTACQRLDRHTIPAIVADYDRVGPEKGWIELPYDVQYIQRTYFEGSDSQVEMSRRFFSIKKRDTVHRPGVENEFERELREWPHPAQNLQR